MQDLKNYVSYSPVTGEFTWLVRKAKRTKVGDVAGYINGRGRWELLINGKRYSASRLAWYFIHKSAPTNQIDHIDGNKLNNSSSNLREATNSENQQNQYKPMKNNKSGFLGVYFVRGRYVASIGLNGKQKFLGSYNTAEEASLRYLSVKKEIHTFSNLK